MGRHLGPVPCGGVAHRMPAHELVSLLRSPAAVDDLAAGGAAAVVVDGPMPEHGVEMPPLLPVVVVADAGGHEVGWSDVSATGDELEAVLRTIAASPDASVALAVLLRGGDGRGVAEGLILESATYAMLQASPEFHAWRAAHPSRDRPGASGDAVRCVRDGDRLQIVLARSEVRNALDADLRDGIAAGLQVALSDPSVDVVLSGDGPTFCSGGHLDEFGTRPDPATAHRVRLARNLGWLLHRLADRTHVFVHGANRGSGIELPAFAGTVTADPDATFGLPELTMGLVPGAGGTVSLPRRVGRHRTAWLAFTGRAVDAETALRWGLVDEIVPRTEWDLERDERA